MISSWQNCRSDFNHDWLNNRYMNRLDGCIERLRIKSADTSRIIRFFTQQFPEWEEKRETAQELILSFESKMSPKVLFEQAQLNRCDKETKKWLRELIHSLWMAKYPVKSWVCEAEQALMCANQQYANLKGALATLNQTNPEELASLLPDFVEYREACRRLSHSISKFPHEVLVV